ncbi:hypothetical protein HanRHA438_Chr13g0599431 [Helianthus annuus]|nr:hypothetical protein HanRHA438_Chr13g0599431 [Helianthus annuus]
MSRCWTFQIIPKLCSVESVLTLITGTITCPIDLKPNQRILSAA